MKRLVELPLTLYTILDTKSNENWHTNQNKGVWFKINHAKSAWTNNQWRDEIKFNDQDRYKIVENTVASWNKQIIN